jgi:hypothetical protein
MCRQFGFQIADLVVQLGDDADCGAGGGGECSSDRGGRGELLGAQRSGDLFGTGIEVALSPNAFDFFNSPYYFIIIIIVTKVVAKAVGS